MLERSEGLADRTKYHVQEIQGIRPHVSVHPTRQPSLDISPIWTPIIAKSKSHNSFQNKLKGKIVFLCRYRTENLSL
jgi:hypothetical protein